MTPLSPCVSQSRPTFLQTAVTGAATTGSQTAFVKQHPHQDLDLAKELDELNIPEEGRFVVLPPA